MGKPQSSATSTARAVTRRLRGPARRDQLLDITCRLIVERSFHGVSIEAVAQRAGLTRAAVYKHFRDLHDLLEGVIDREMTRALVQVSETTPVDVSDGGPVKVMLEGFTAFLAAVEEEPARWKLVLMPPEGAPAILQERIAVGRAIIVDRLAGAVAPALALDPDYPDPELTARMLSAVSDEYARLLLTDPVRFSKGRLMIHAEWFARRLLGGPLQAAAPSIGRSPKSRRGAKEASLGATQPI
jgi:AcrR family transcriptional regulator